MATVAGSACLRRTVFAEDQRAFRESVRAFVDREIWPAREGVRERRGIGRALWRTAGEHGFLGLSVPEEHGGAGTHGDFRFNAVLQEELARPGTRD